MVDPKNVFLAQFQAVDHDGVVLPDVRQALIVAESADEAGFVVGQQKWVFLGMTSLQQYEDAVRKLRAAIEGRKEDWPLVVAPGMGASLKPHQVFLLQYQVLEGIGEARQAKPKIEQACVVAQDAQAAASAVAEEAPDWLVCGLVSLAEFEQSVIKVRDAVEGRSSEWPLLVGPSMDALVA